jgi:hypothetical protein
MPKKKSPKTEYETMRLARHSGALLKFLELMPREAPEAMPERPPEHKEPQIVRLGRGYVWR